MPLSTIEAQKVIERNQMIDVNLKGTLYGVSAALPYMASVYGHITIATGAVYCATEHAVRSLSQGLRQEVKQHNIRVMVIPPGARRIRARHRGARIDHVGHGGLCRLATGERGRERNPVPPHRSAAKKAEQTFRAGPGGAGVRPGFPCPVTV